MSRPNALLLAGLLLVGLGSRASADEPLEVEIAGEWYLSQALTEPVSTGAGYLALRLVQAQVITGKSGWFDSFFLGNQGAKQAFVSLDFDYGNVEIKAPIAYGQVRPDNPRFPQANLQVTPWLPICTSSNGAPISPRITLMVRSVPLREGGLVQALQVMAGRASLASDSDSGAVAADCAQPGLLDPYNPIFGFMRAFEAVCEGLWPADHTPRRVTTELVNHSTGEVQLPRYLLMVEPGTRLERKRDGAAEAFPWSQWEERLRLPGLGSSASFVTWADSGERLDNASFVLLQVEVLPPNFRDDLESLQNAAGLWQALDETILQPMEQDLKALTDEQPRRDCVAGYMKQLSRWLKNERRSLCREDMKTICQVVEAYALQEAGLSPKVSRSSLSSRTWRDLVLDLLPDEGLFQEGALTDQGPPLAAF